MVKQTRNRNSKAMGNIKSAANSSLHTTGKLASKGLEKTAKWLVTDHTGATQRSSIMELEQRINYQHAKLALRNRRTKRLNDRVNRVINTGVNDSTPKVAADWLIDHTCYVFDLLWGFIRPLVSFLIWSIFKVILIVLFNGIFFYALFWLLFS